MAELNQYKRVEIKGVLTITTTQENHEELKKTILTKIRQALNEANLTFDPSTVVDFEIKSITELPF